MTAAHSWLVVNVLTDLQEGPPWLWLMDEERQFCLFSLCSLGLLESVVFQKEGRDMGRTVHAARKEDLGTDSDMQCCGSACWPRQ